MTPITPLDNLNIQLPSRFQKFSYRQARALTFQREISLLSRSELSTKISKGEAICLNPESTGHRVYVYIDNENVCPLAKVHFYDEKGDVMFTYPWDGNCEKHGENYTLVTNDHQPLCGLDNSDLIYSLQLTATEKGRIAIRSKEHGGSAPIMPRDFYAFSIYRNTGNEDRIWGAVNWTGYQGTKPGDKGESSEPDYCQSWMQAIATDGDKLIDHALEHSYVI